MIPPDVKSAVEKALKPFANMLPDSQEPKDALQHQLQEWCRAAREALAQLAALPEATPQWRCFHCDEVFSTPETALEHFGPHCLSDPACSIDIAKFREMEEIHARHLAEDSDADREFHRMRADHNVALRREEEKGYERGLRDARKELAALPSPSEGAEPTFNCNCPHEVRSGCSDPECPHYVPAKPPQGAVTEELLSIVDDLEKELRHGRAGDLSNVVARTIEYSRACLTAAQAVATEQGEVGAVSHIIDPKTFNLLKRALRPFAATVCNDNGDVTIDTSRLHTTDYMAAQKAFDALEHEQSGEAKG